MKKSFTKKSIRAFESEDNWEENDGKTAKILASLFKKKAKILLKDIFTSRISLENRFWFLANRVLEDETTREKLALGIFEIIKKSGKYTKEVEACALFIVSKINYNEFFWKVRHNVPVTARLTKKNLEYIYSNLAFTSLMDAISGARRAVHDPFLRGDYVGNNIADAIANFVKLNSSFTKSLSTLLLQYIGKKKV